MTVWQANVQMAPCPAELRLAARRGGSVACPEGGDVRLVSAFPEGGAPWPGMGQAPTSPQQAPQDRARVPLASSPRGRRLGQ